MSDDKFHRLLSRAAPSLLSLLEAHNREIELATARKVLEVACKPQCNLCERGYGAVRNGTEWWHESTARYGLRERCWAGPTRNAILALYPELAQPVEPRAAAHAGVSGLHFAQPGDFTQLHRNEPVEPGKEPTQ